MKTLRAGLIGEHISRTRLPGALEIMCAEVGWMLDFTLLDTADDPDFDFNTTVDLAREDGWTGVTVTHPWKTDAARYAGDAMHKDVAHLGASNTLVFAPDLRGYNTDYTGFLSAFQPIADRGPVVMVGAGGVARSIGAALIGQGITDLAIHDLEPARAADLASGLGPPAHAIPSEDLPDALRAASGLVNATPQGMKEYPGSAIDTGLLGPQVWAFDAVYTPTETEFLIAARSAGLTVLTGFELFRHMAIRSFEAYTSISLDLAEVLPKLEVLRP